MKNILYKSLIVLTLGLTLNACSSDDTEEVTGNGNLVLEFDNAYGNNDLIFDVATAANSNKETLKINKLKYIVSNVVLTKADGTTFTYPKADSYFIADESGETELELLNIPAGDYTKVTFGIGVDEDQWALGAEGQGDFLAKAQAAGMMWSWSAGYKFLAFEGTYTSATYTDAQFRVHTGQTGTDYNYTTVTLDLPTKALVRTTITPTIHFIADANKILDGVNKISLTDANTNGTGSNIMGGDKLPLVTVNVSKMFTVDHVHND